MKIIIQIIATGIVSYTIVLILVPIFTRVASRIGLMDKPNARKIHYQPVPVIGGIVIALAVASLMATNALMYFLPNQLLFVLLAAMILLIVGVADDLYDIRAKYKLIIQLFCAFLISSAGVRITSFYGFLGVETIPVLVQYIVTIILITGIINAFNLMDGIDGLAGIIFSIGFLILITLAAFMKNYEAVLFFIPFFGAIIAFLRFNLSTKKIFIGDAGTLFVGTLLIGSSIYMLNQSVGTTQSAHLVVIHLFIGFFSLPVLDSLRVYLGRMKKGQSAFKADKTHLHHLILLFNRSHKKTALIISFIIVLFLLTAFIGAYFITLSTYFFLILIGFSFLAYLLNLNQKVLYWQQKMHEIENNSTSSVTI